MSASTTERAPSPDGLSLEALHAAPAHRVGAVHRASDRATVVGGLTAWVALVGLALWWGRASIAGRGLAVNAAPLVGHWVWHPRFAVVIPAVLAVVVVAAGPRAAARLPWTYLPVVAGAVAAAWASALAASDGWHQVTRPLTTRHEYEPFATHLGGAGEFLRHFVDRLPGLPIHVQGHPPGAPLVPWALDAIGLSGAGWFAAVVLAGWGLAVGSTLAAARSVAGERAARRAAPALVLLPAAVWAGTSADALFAGVLAIGIAIALARRERGQSRRAAALAGGAMLGLGLLLTYGGAAMVAIPCLVLLRRRHVADGVLVVLGAGAVLVITAAITGFWWLDGLHATHARYLDGVAGDRPASYFALAGNPGALALAVGPAVAVGLLSAVRRWRDATALLPLVALATVAAVDVSLLSKGEVERIWLPFLPWLALAAPGHRRVWLAVQAALALVLQVWLRGKW